MYETVLNSAEVIAGVFGIAVSIVPMIVMLAATRYNHRITGLFIRQPLNVLVLSFFVLTIVVCLWVASVPKVEGELWLHRITLGMVTFALLVLLPYFAYVLSFVSPLNFIKRISTGASQGIERCSSSYDPRQRCAVVFAVENVYRVLCHSIDEGEPDIAIGCVDALAEFLRGYQQKAAQLPAAWFDMDETMRLDPDFISLEPSALNRISENRTWLEYKTLSKFADALSLCMPRQHEVADQIGICTRGLCLEQQQDSKQLELFLAAFNTFLRRSINKRDPRTALFLFGQYRDVAEAMVDRHWGPEVVEIVDRMIFFGRYGAVERRQPFILEVCAFDLVRLLKKSVGELDDAVDVILNALLDPDVMRQRESSDEPLGGVLRAQIQAAAVLLARGDAARADRVITVLTTAPRSRVTDVILELERQQTINFPELTPRGVNFLFLPAEERVQLEAVRRRLAGLQNAG